jgi:hypothetical protein
MVANSRDGLFDLGIFDLEERANQAKISACLGLAIRGSDGPVPVSDFHGVRLCQVTATEKNV